MGGQVLSKPRKVSFEIAAGQSAETFALYDRTLYARPLTLRQLLDLEKMDAGMDAEEQMSVTADLLTERVADGGDDITADWLMDNLTERDNLMVAYVLRNGKIPTEGN
jgi:hypothetical protein